VKPEKRRRSRYLKISRSGYAVKLSPVEEVTKQKEKVAADQKFPG